MRRLRCPKCENRFEVDDEARTIVSCPECGQKMRLAATAAAPTPAANIRKRPIKDEDTPPTPFPKRSRAVEEDDDRPRGRSRYDEDEEDERSRDEEDDDEDRPRRKKKKKRRRSEGAIPGVSNFIALLIGIMLLELLLSLVTLRVPELGIAVMIIGNVMLCVAGIWGIVQAFREEIVVGLLYLFVPFFFLYFVVTRWSIAWKPFTMYCCGMLCTLVGFGAIVFGKGLHSLQNAPGPQMAMGMPNNNFAPGPAPVPVVAAKAPPANADPLTRTLFDVENGDFFRKKAALEQLSLMTPDDARRQEVVKVLETQLGDQNVFVRRVLVPALVQWSGKDCVPTLLRILNDQDPHIHSSAIEGLGRLKDERAIEPLAERLNDSSDRSHVSKALQMFGPAAEKAVAKQLQNKDFVTRIEVCKVLGVIGTQDSVSALEALVKAKDFFCSKHAQEALQAIAARK